MPASPSDPDAPPSAYLRSPDKRPAALASDYGALAASVAASDGGRQAGGGEGADDGSQAAATASLPADDEDGDALAGVGNDELDRGETVDDDAEQATARGLPPRATTPPPSPPPADSPPPPPPASDAGSAQAGASGDAALLSPSSPSNDDDSNGVSTPTPPPPPPPPLTNPNPPAWTATPRHLLAVTAAGKPILALGCGDSGGRGGQVAGLAAAGAALAEYSEGGDGEGDALVSLSFPPAHTLLFTRHGHIRFIVASSLSEPPAALAAVAAAAHGALTSLATSALHTALSRSPRLDAGALLGANAVDVVAAALGDADRCPLAVAGAYSPLPLPARRRSAAAAALATATDACGATAGALLAPDGAVVALAGGWAAGDVRAVAAVLTATRDGADRDALVPVCLPIASGACFMHAYVSRVVDGGAADANPQRPLTLALLLPSPAAADAARAAADAATDALRTAGVLAAASASRPPAPGDVGGAVAACVTHFAARSAARSQLLSSSSTATGGPPPGGIARARAALLGGGVPLGAAADAVAAPGADARARHAPPGADARPPARCYWEEREEGSLLALRSAEYELYVSGAAGTRAATAAAAARAVGGWVRARAGDLFLPVADG